MIGRIGIVALRDFLAVVRTKGFIIGLFFMPTIMFASVQIPKLMERFGEVGDRKFAVADFTGRLAAPLADRIAQKDAEPGRKLKLVLENVDVASHADGATGADFESRRAKLVDELAARVRKDELFGYVIIGPDALATPDLPPARPGAEPPRPPPEQTVSYGAISLTVGDLLDTLREALNECARRTRYAGSNLDPELVARLDRKLHFDEFRVAKREGGPGVEQSSGGKEAAAPIGFAILLLMGVMQSAGLLLNSTIEEKSSRVIEVLVSSVSALELLAGKVIGAFLSGLVVVVVWGVGAWYAAHHFGVVSSGALDPDKMFWFVLFLVTGYLLFASLYVAVGAMCNTIQDAQSMMMPIVILIMIPMFSISHVVNHPDSVLSQALTYFPFSAPFIAMMRVQLSPPAPTWQIALGALSVSLGAWFLMWAGAKVFRIAIFMTGKPPRPREIVRWIREA